MTNAIQSAIEELRRERQAIDDLIIRLERFGGGARFMGTDHDFNPPTPAAAHKKPRRCTQHPESDRTPRGECIVCRRIYQREWKRSHPQKRKEHQNIEGSVAIHIADIPAAPRKPGRPRNPGNGSAVPASSDSLNETTNGFAEPAAVSPTPDPIQWVYSKLLKCPKCSQPGIRLRRRENADLTKDHWLHMRTDSQPPCTAKIALYSVSVDQHYKPKELQ